MRIQELRLESFKRFSKENVEFKPITLLTGPNSSGKSSVLSALSAIFQSAENGFPANLSLNGPYSRLGEFRNVVKGHSAKNSFTLGVTVRVKGEAISLSGTYKANADTGGATPKSISIKDDHSGVVLQWNQKKKAFFLSYSKGESLEKQDPLTLLFTPDLYNSIIDSGGANVGSDGKLRSRTIQSVWAEVTKGSKFDFDQIRDFVSSQVSELEKGSVKVEGTDIAGALQSTDAFLPVRTARDRISRKFKSFVKKVSHVGPVRAFPLRYYASTSTVLEVDPIGDSVAQRLALWKETSKTKFNQVKDALVELELATEIEAKRSLGEFFQLSVRPLSSGGAETIADVGFGVSQILPVVVNDVSLEDDGVLIVNQPEVHLHPSSQALLGNYFASRCEKRQYVIETHSEYLITRLRVLIASGKLDSSAVSIIYIDDKQEAGGKVFHQVRIDEKGLLIGAPASFFQTYVADTYDLAMQGFADDE